MSGLPATGKSTIARRLAIELGAAYVRIDTIETALRRAEGAAEDTNKWELPSGYEVGYDIATDQLRIGLDVVADSVNPLRTSRDRWREAGHRADAGVIEVEIVCSDAAEHRQRAEERVLDIPGLAKPTWQQITSRECDSWERDHIVIDTALVDIDDAVRMVSDACRAKPHGFHGEDLRPGGTYPG